MGFFDSVKKALGYEEAERYIAKVPKIVEEIYRPVEKVAEEIYRPVEGIGEELMREYSDVMAEEKRYLESDYFKAALGVATVGLGLPVLGGIFDGTKTDPEPVSGPITYQIQPGSYPAISQPPIVSYLTPTGVPVTTAAASQNIIILIALGFGAYFLLR